MPAWKSCGHNMDRQLCCFFIIHKHFSRAQNLWCWAEWSRKCVVPPEAIKKPEVVKVHIYWNEQCGCERPVQALLPTGTTSRKRCKYHFWFFINISMVNAFIRGKIAGKKKRCHLNFQYKVLTSILCTNTKLREIGFRQHDLCTFCKA